MKYLTMFTVLLLIGCKSTDDKPFYNTALIDAGYMAKLDYWQPQVPKFSASSTAKYKETRKKLVSQGAVVLIYEYEIDSNGNTQNINLLKTIPDGIATNKDIIQSQLIYTKWKPTLKNHTNQPLKVKERLVLMPNLSIAIPPDDETILEFVKTLKKKT